MSAAIAVDLARSACCRYALPSKKRRHPHVVSRCDVQKDPSFLRDSVSIGFFCPLETLDHLNIRNASATLKKSFLLSDAAMLKCGLCPISKQPDHPSR
jgi:hypothetical protein